MPSIPSRALNARRAAWPVAALLPFALAACGGSNDGPMWPPANGAYSAACTGLAASAKLAGTTLATSYVPPDSKRPGGAATGAFLPGHCVVTGSINPRVGVDGKNYAIGFQLSLPDNWNGRFLFVGGGGNDGVLRDTSLSTSISIGTPSPLGQGFAVVSTDGGHIGTTASFGADPQARIDHAYNSYDKTAVSAKSLIASHYGRKPDRSYFSGCSGGGRQGMVFSQRFPDYFDAITAGAPAMRVSSGATVAAMWNTIAFNAIAPQDASGNRILSQAFSNADLNLVANAVKSSCDAADGVADGMVNNTKACQFNPAVLQCSGAKGGDCLSAGQVDALAKVFTGPRNSAGQALYAGQPWDPGLAAPGWRAWTLGSSTTATPDARYITLMVDALINEFFTPPDLSFNPLAFNFDTDPARMSAYSAIYDTYADDKLTAFRQRGGKLLLIHGMSDPIFSSKDTVDYYERLAANNGGMASTQGFARTFLVPGMNHCSGGPATDSFDSIQTMVDWVEKGVAPDTIAARALPTQTDYPNRTRRLCAYPQFAKYKGTGSVEDAGSFVCAVE
ncbi:tannase/feruloyl esterase family alpha/beta hydrolase [Acidovorax sp. A1169]|uniref:tannase/feruloyl esterase family alpha/beta hydrolase n=1 Tax=Acidovorax sp. A1169 TaxID=3059524 RepID=UPI002737E467|nr:tannase/feruloyl esterase family alpha/beta hydrolase [Acidovorax sp. A1169]MDP4074077.1 tannase/feruloyl esterase family alpha/beta hydrolase [Acidovorax sp. A1169]